VIEEAQIVVHEGHKPDLLGDFLDAHCLPGKSMIKIDPAFAEAGAPTARDRAIVEGISGSGSPRYGRVEAG
jgi:hypothetical protein